MVWAPRILRRARFSAADIAVPVAPEKKSIAVLPLAAIADDPKLTAFGKGLLEDVAAKLSQLSANHDLEVISPRALEDKKVATLADAKKEFGVNLGLAVSLKQDGDLVRASYNLIDTSTDKNLAGDSITAPVSDLFTIEDKLTSGIADALHINLRSEERQALGAHATTLPEAYQYFVQGIGYLQHSSEQESLTSAEIVFKQALKLDQITVLHKRVWAKPTCLSTTILSRNAGSSRRNGPAPKLSNWAMPAPRATPVWAHSKMLPDNLRKPPNNFGRRCSSTQ